MIRSCIDVDTSSNVVPFLNELGFRYIFITNFYFIKLLMQHKYYQYLFHFRLDYEFVLKGFMFRKGRMKVTVAKVCRVSICFKYFQKYFSYFNRKRNLSLKKSLKRKKSILVTIMKITYNIYIYNIKFSKFQNICQENKYMQFYFCQYLVKIIGMYGKLKKKHAFCAEIK